MQVNVLYFAWVRERIGHGAEVVETSAATVADLMAELVGKGPEYEAAFSDVTALRAAVDQTLVDMDAPLGQAREVAFFPPMTGG